MRVGGQSIFYLVRKDNSPTVALFFVTTHFISIDHPRVSHSTTMDLELHDWEVLEHSTSPHTTSYLDGIQQNPEEIIRFDHFSLDSHLQDVTDQIHVDSVNPSSIDPVCDANHSINTSIGENSSADGSDDGRCVDSESSKVVCDESVCDSGEVEAKACGFEKVDEELEEVVEERGEGSNEGVLVESMKSGSEVRDRVGVWWKLPLDLLKYCLFKASPVWSLSVAAAMMGAVILGRRLYRMKQKTRILQLKVTVDDKKASQVMSRAARLNEAFSVVKRAPIIRPSLPASGNAPWPMMAIR